MATNELLQLMYNYFPLILIFVGIVLTIVIVWLRERSWNKLVEDQKLQIDILLQVKDSLLYRLAIEQKNNEFIQEMVCSNNTASLSIDNESNSTQSTLVHTNSSVFPDRVFFDWVGVSYGVCITCCLIGEYYLNKFIFSTDKEEEEPAVDTKEKTNTANTSEDSHQTNQNNQKETKQTKKQSTNTPPNQPNPPSTNEETKANDQTTNENEEANQTKEQIKHLKEEMKKKLFQYLQRQHLLTNLVFFSILTGFGFGYFYYVYDSLGVPMHMTMIYQVYKWVLWYLLSIFLYYLTFNIMEIYLYLPKTLETWKQSLRDVFWWKWFGFRIFGIIDFTISIQNILWLVCLLYYCYPIRYYFYYSHESCPLSAIKPSLTSGFTTQELFNMTIPSLHASNSLDGNTSLSGNHPLLPMYRNFFLSTIYHNAFLFVCINYFYAILVYLPYLTSPRVIKLNALLEGSSFYAKNAWWIIALNQYGYRILSFGSKENVVLCVVIGLCVNALVYLIKVLYYQWYMSCSWYNWWLTWICFHIHIGLIIYSLPGLNSLMQRVRILKAQYVTFLEVLQQNYTDIQQELLTSKQHITQEELLQQISQEEILCAISDEFFMKPLFYSIQYCLFCPQVTANNNDKNNNEETTNNHVIDEESRVNLIFQIFFSGNTFVPSNTNETSEPSDSTTPQTTSENHNPSQFDKKDKPIPTQKEEKEEQSSMHHVD